MIRVRRVKIAALFICILAVQLCGSFARGADIVSYPVHALEKAPTIDGDVEGDAVWKNIPRATGFQVLGGARKVPKQSSFKMGFTPKALYVGVVCKEPDMAKVTDRTKDGDPEIFDDDGVEVFVYPTKSDKILQVIANTAGARTDYLNRAAGEWHETAPKPLSRAAAFKGKDFYSIEIVIPFEKLGHKPSDGDIWRGNVVRNMLIDGPIGPNRGSTWVRLVRGALEPENFARLVFHNSPPAGEEIVIDSGSTDKDDVELHLIVDLKFNEGNRRIAHGQSALINDGKIIGAQWVPRDSGFCLKFEKGGRVEIPHSDSLGGINKAMTLECWAYFDLDKLAGTRGTLMSTSPSSGFASGFYLDYVDSGTNTRSICFGVAAGGSPNRFWPIAQNAIKTSGWHHVLATYDPQLTDGWRMKIYIDGQKQHLKPNWRNKKIIPRPSGLPLFIGAKPVSRAKMTEMTATFLGKIDDVKVWDAALTPEDIQRLYGSLWSKSNPISPQPSEVIRDGKPRFAWSSSGDGTSYVFEMTKVPDFSSGIVVKETLQEANYRVSKPLSPGIYYWRVWSTNKKGEPTASSKPRAFIVPLEKKFEPADTIPPAITDVKPVRDTTAEDAKPRISARWSDDQGIDIKTARLLLDGADVTAKAEVNTEGISFAPSTALTKGIHTIEVSVKDTGGNNANRVRQHFAVAEPYRTVVKIDEYRRTTINGEPYFPRIIYVTIGNPLSHPWFEKLARAGFNSFHYVVPVPACEIKAKESGRPLEEIYYWKKLKLMEKTGLKLYGDIGNYFNRYLLKELYGFEKKNPSIYEKAAERFAESCAYYDQHVEILAYKIDEPSGQEGHDRCKAMWKGLQAGGHNRPAFWVLNSPDGTKILGETADGIGIDCYPVPSRPLVQVAKYIDRTHLLQDYKKPVWFVPQAFDWRLLHAPYTPFSRSRTREQVLENLPKDFVFTPTPRQIRCMTYLGLAHDIQGILWWSLCWQGKYLNIVDFPEDWKAFLELAGEIRYLSPMMLSTKYVDIAGDYEKLGIHLVAKSFDGKIYIVAVNPNEDLPVAPSFKLPAGSYSKVDVLFENRSMKLSGNTFQDFFNPLDVHIYQITPE